MKLNSQAVLVGIAIVAAALVAPSLRAQDTKSTPAAEPKPKKDQHLITFGLGARFIVAGTVKGSTTTSTVTDPSSTINYSGSATAMKYLYGAMLELRLNRHFSVVTEGVYHKVSYKEADTTTYNAPIPRGVLLNVAQEDTKARVFEFPVLLKFRNITSSGPLSHVFLSGGAAFRMVSNIKTTSTLTYSDSTTKTSTAAAVPNKRTAVGYAAGAGMRFTDELGIKVTPEARYTRWMDSNFKLPGVNFPKDQVEVGVSFSF